MFHTKPSRINFGVYMVGRYIYLNILTENKLKEMIYRDL